MCAELCPDTYTVHVAPAVQFTVGSAVLQYIFINVYNAIIINTLYTCGLDSPCGWRGSG